jgi:hypothetical protein
VAAERAGQGARRSGRVDASKLEAGQMLKVVWRGQPVFVVRRSRRSSISSRTTTPCSRIRSPTIRLQPDYIKASGAARARNPEYWVGLAVCTHLGCSPLGAFEPNNAFQVRGPIWAELAGRLLLPLPRLEVRHLGPCLQEHAGAEEPDGSAVRVRADARVVDRRRRRESPKTVYATRG